jgi:hypothetical protein
LSWWGFIYCCIIMFLFPHCYPRHRDLPIRFSSTGFISSLNVTRLLGEK